MKNLYLITLCLLVVAAACNRRPYAVFAPSKAADWSGTTAGTAVASAAPVVDPLPPTPVSVSQPVPALTAPRVYRASSAPHLGKNIFKNASRRPATQPAPTAHAIDQPKRHSVAALFSFGFGVLAIFLLFRLTIWPWLGLVSLLLALAALILGIVALTRIHRDPVLGGNGFAIIGIVAGGAILLVFGLLIYALANMV